MIIFAPIADQTATDNGRTIGVWLDDLGREGHSVKTKVMPPGCSVADVFEARLSVAPEHMSLLGNLPIPYVIQDPDGHDDGSNSCFGDCLAPYGGASLAEWRPRPDGVYQASFWPSDAQISCSMIDFSGLPTLGEERELFDRYMALNHAWRTGAFDYNNEACYVDYLEQLIPVRQRIIADLQDVVGGAVHVHDLSTGVEAERYHFFSVNAGQAFLAGALFDGGAGREGGVGEWNTGSMADFASGLVKIGVLLLYCSNAWMFRNWPLQRAALVGGSLAVLYDRWGTVSLSGWDEKVTLSQLLHRQQTRGRDTIQMWIGDGTLKRRLGDMANDPRVDGVIERVEALERKQSVIGPPVIVILEAEYRRLDERGAVDATAAVRKLVDAGGEWHVHPGLVDFAEGFEKELYIRWTLNGVEYKKIFAQYDRVDKILAGQL